MEAPAAREVFIPLTLAPYFSNTDRPVFALINLPETVKGALFARYSRSAKSLRRLFLDEFLGDVRGDTGGSGVRLQPDIVSGFSRTWVRLKADPTNAWVPPAPISCTRRY